MSQTITQGRLRIDANFKRFVDEEVLPGVELDAAAFWRNFDQIVHDLAPENRQLLAERDRIQAALDEWHRSNPGPMTRLTSGCTVLPFKIRATRIMSV